MLTNGERLRIAAEVNTELLRAVLGGRARDSVVAHVGLELAWG